MAGVKQRAKKQRLSIKLLTCYNSISCGSEEEGTHTFNTSFKFFFFVSPMSYGAPQQHYPAPPPAYEEEARQPLFGNASDEDDMYKETVANSPVEVRMRKWPTYYFLCLAMCSMEWYRTHTFSSSLLLLEFVRKVYSILSTQILSTVVLSAVYMYNAGVRSWVQSKYVNDSAKNVITRAHLRLLFVVLGWCLDPWLARWLFSLPWCGRLDRLLWITVYWHYSRSWKVILLAQLVSIILLLSLSLWWAQWDIIWLTFPISVTFYEQTLVLQALIITFGVFVGLTLFTLQSKWDFSGMGPL